MQLNFTPKWRRKMPSLKVEKFKMKGWISHEQLKKVVVFTKPKANGSEVMIDVVPIKKGVSKC